MESALHDFNPFRCLSRDSSRQPMKNNELKVIIASILIFRWRIGRNDAHSRRAENEFNN